MSEHEKLIRRLDELGAVAVGGTSAPPFDAHGRRRQRARRHQRRWLAGVAVVAVAITGTALWGPWAGDDDRVDTVASTLPADDSFPRLLPQDWIGSDGIATRPPSEEPSVYDPIAQHLLARDGVTVGAASVRDFPVGEGTPDDGAQETLDVLDGREARWITNAGRTSLELALDPGRAVTIFMADTDASREELEALAVAYDNETLDFDPNAMPAGWSTQADPADVVQLSGGIPPSSWAGARLRPDPSSATSTIVAATHVEDPAAALDQFVGLTGERAQRVSVDGKDGAMVVGPSPLGVMVVWVQDPSTIAAVTHPSEDLVQAVAIAESVREVDAATWESFYEDPAPPPAKVIDGFELRRADEEVLDFVELSGHRWLFTTSPVDDDMPTMGAEITSMIWTYMIDPEGNQQSSGSGGTGIATGMSTWVNGPYRYFQAHVPRDVTDPTAVLHGDPLEMVFADIGEVNLVALGVVEARSTPRVDPGDMYISGTRSDGTDWREPPAPPPP